MIMNAMNYGRAVCLGLAALAAAASPAEPKGFELKVKTLATECRDEAATRIEGLIKSGKLTQAQVFDTFYIPIANTYPQKFHTQYDQNFDEAFRDLLDSYLKKNPRFVFVILSDRNGYVPTHNSIFSKPLTGSREYDAKNNRAKVMFNDRTGLAAARNTAPYLLQEYQRDTGEAMFDLSVPLVVRGQPWGCVRVGYRKE
jgi:methyl-accepting chemotaxis protein